MESGWYVTPEVKRLDLPGGQWIEIKNELTIGESKAAASLATKYVRVDGDIVEVLDSRQYDVELMLAHLVGWSATDEKGLSLPLSREAVLAQRPSKYREIATAILNHRNSLEKEKNAQTSEGEAPKISSDIAAS